MGKSPLSWILILCKWNSIGAWQHFLLESPATNMYSRKEFRIPKSTSFKNSELKEANAALALSQFVLPATLRRKRLSSCCFGECRRTSECFGEVRDWWSLVLRALVLRAQPPELGGFPLPSMHARTSKDRPFWFYVFCLGFVWSLEGLYFTHPR